MNFESKYLTAAKDRGSYLAIVLDENARKDILDHFTPKFKKIDCHHITIEYNNPTEALEHKFKDASLEVVGYQFGEGVDCVVVAVNGVTQRPDGSTFHVTLSLKGGHKPVESNAILKQQGYNKVIPFEISGTVTLLPK